MKLPSSMRWLIVVAVALVTCGGCGSRSSRSELGSVTGAVTLDGRPIPNAKIHFVSANSRMAVGSVIDGKIVEVTTYSPGDGAPVGSQVVTIEERLSAEAEAALMSGKPVPRSAGPKIPDDYKSATRSDLKVEITSGTNVLDLKLQSKGGAGA